jgi:hypothetical protein
MKSTVSGSALFSGISFHEAHIANFTTGIADLKESQTVALMEVLLYKNIFTEDHFIVNSEQPPSSRSGHRCDLVVRYLDSTSNHIKALCFAECKRSSTSRYSALKSLEIHARDYCRMYIAQQRGVTFVYAAAMAGAHVMLYKVTNEDMIPFWGSGREGDWNNYLDVGVDADALESERGFAQMKQFPPTPHVTQTSSTYGPMPVQTPGSSAPLRGSHAVNLAQGRSS